MKKMLKKSTSFALAMIATVASMGIFTACETKKPEVEMKIEYAGEVYTLEYTLYREVAPATVKHFITLAENNYYDGLCVHSYDESANKMYTGAYKYQAGAENGGLVYQNYYDIVSKYSNFNHTVWVDSDKVTPTYTLKGEFSANSFKVESGALKQSFGSLAMFYTAKDFDDLEKVAVLRSDGEKTDNRAYEYNSATSQFTIALSKTETSNANYCTFATLNDDSVEVLEALLAAIDEYETDFVEEIEMEIDKDDAILGDRDNEATYKVPVSPIVIKSVKVTKY